MKIIIKSILFSLLLLISNSSFSAQIYYFSSPSAALSACEDAVPSGSYSCKTEGTSSDDSVSYNLVYTYTNTVQNRYWFRSCGAYPDMCVPEPSSCPSGQVDIGSEGSPNCVDICVSGQSTSVRAPLDAIPNKIITSSGCTALYNPSTDINCKSSSSIYCTVFYSETSLFNEDNPCDGSSYLNCYTDADGGTNTVKDEVLDSGSPIPTPVTTENKVISPETTEAITDGTATTSTETTTKTINAGTTIEQIGNTIVKKDSTGNIIEIIKQGTFNSYSDGSATEITTSTTNATPSTNSSTIYSVTNNTTTTNTSTSGTSGSTTKTTTIAYNISGQATNEDSTSTGSLNTGAGVDTNGDGEADTLSFCEYASTVCDFISWFKGDGTQVPEHPDMPSEEIDVSDYQSEWTSGVGSGSCPSGVSIELFSGKSYTFDYTNACVSATTVFKPIFLLLCTLSGAFILAGFKK